MGPHTGYTNCAVSALIKTKRRKKIPEPTLDSGKLCCNSLQTNNTELQLLILNVELLIR
jgi:hypothetical protein